MLAKVNLLNMLRICKVIPLVLLALHMQDAIAASDPDYDVEIVILEDLSGRYANAENWPVVAEEAVSGDKNRAHLATGNADKKIKILLPESFRLSDKLKPMEDSKEYKILLHTAWRQTGLDKPAAFPVHIATDNQVENEDSSYIEGGITLVMSRYLHISGNLMFYKQGKDGYVPYPVNFDRRMRSREIHYIDHPMISILVLATPVR